MLTRHSFLSYNRENLFCNGLALSGRLSASSSPKGRALGKEIHFAWTAKASHFGKDSPRCGEKCHRR
ncbi:hypothetical protein C4N25_04295 [Faecalibacterium prausnitzii]|uniref:Uncharacterized protein n=1 Tax=Faecalibacterium prausnitzii TaxID=853 RepID=A0A329TNE8_9FIRM|nr:hypothetical protein C4N25_04295 [Faecalibacterium prausnitzii]